MIFIYKFITKIQCDLHVQIWLLYKTNKQSVLKFYKNVIVKYIYCNDCCNTDKMY